MSHHSLVVPIASLIAVESHLLIDYCHSTALPQSCDVVVVRAMVRTIRPALKAF
jgi:hypothetical protein